MITYAVSPPNLSVRKLTISLPAELVEFADRQAARLHTSRSQIIGLALAEVKAKEEERLAIEGYQFYAQEAIEFAELSAQANVEAFGEYSSVNNGEATNYAS